MRRREFVTLLGGAVVWPIVASAQQPQALRRIGILTGLDEVESKLRIDPLVQELQRLGWVEGRNIKLDRRAAGANTRQSPGASSNQVPAGDQSQDREGIGSGGAAAIVRGADEVIE